MDHNNLISKSEHKRNIFIQTLKINATNGMNHSGIKIEDLHSAVNNLFSFG